MKAAILKEIGEQLIAEEIVEPALIANAVKIKILSAHVLSYAQEVFQAKELVG